MPTSVPPTRRVLIVHRHSLLREALAVILTTRADVADVVQAASAAEARRLVEPAAFGAALIDLGLPEADVAPLIEALRRAGTRVVGLTGAGAAAGRRRRPAGIDAMAHDERPLAVLLDTLLPSDDPVRSAPGPPFDPTVPGV
jgi:DNA-binding NarL/FixJ family response regulator